MAGLLARPALISSDARLAQCSTPAGGPLGHLPGGSKCNYGVRLQYRGHSTFYSVLGGAAPAAMRSYAHVCEEMRGEGRGEGRGGEGRGWRREEVGEEIGRAHV